MEKQGIEPVPPGLQDIVLSPTPWLLLFINIGNYQGGIDDNQVQFWHSSEFIIGIIIACILTIVSFKVADHNKL